VEGFGRDSRGELLPNESGIERHIRRRFADQLLFRVSIKISRRRRNRIGGWLAEIATRTCWVIMAVDDGAITAGMHNFTADDLRDGQK